MSGYRTALSALHALETFGMRLGLENVADYCAAAGYPERAYPALHVAGTNGKGTTAACLAALARRHGLRAGLYTSPHLVDFRERIRVDGEPISRPGFVAMWNRVGSFAQERSMTFFEAGTLMALEWFAERGVDVAVLEIAPEPPRAGPAIVLGLPSGSEQSNDRRYPVAVLGRRFHGLLTSSFEIGDPDLAVRSPIWIASTR